MNFKSDVFFEQLFNMPRFYKRLVTILFDTFFVIFSIWLAFSLRLDGPYLPPPSQLIVFVIAPVIAIPVFVYFGLYRAIIRYVGFRALWSIFKAVMVYGLIWSLAVLLISPEGIFPRSVHILHLFINLILIGASRMVGRYAIYAYLNELSDGRPLASVVVYGAGKSGIQLVSALVSSRQYRVIGYLDDNPRLRRQQINGLTVFAFSELPKLIDEWQVKEVFLAMPSLSRSRRNEILTQLEPFAVKVKTIPDFVKIAQGTLKASDIQDVSIEDILGRDAVLPDESLLKKNIQDKVVCITGAGGSIGSELARQALRWAPRQLILLDHNEFSLYQIDQQLRQSELACPVMPILATITELDRLKKLLMHFQVETLFHAAAYKHVPLVEHNLYQGLYNNVIGTKNVALAAMAAKVSHVVLISTDKAVRPTNVMGASKRLAELVFQAFNQHPDAQATTFSMVRFGNVLGSSGSVVPLFKSQIEAGKPITLTDKRITRFFMTISEAAELVIQAGALSEGGDVFVLDMGEPVRIYDLARRMIHLSGLEIFDEDHPYGDIPIEIIGLRPGEKLYEELILGQNITPTFHPKIARARETFVPWDQLDVKLDALIELASRQAFEPLREALAELVEGYAPQSAVVDFLARAGSPCDQTSRDGVIIADKLTD